VGLGCVFVCLCVYSSVSVLCVCFKGCLSSRAGGGVGEGVYLFVCVSISVLCICFKDCFSSRVILRYVYVCLCVCVCLAGF